MISLTLITSISYSQQLNENDKIQGCKFQSTGPEVIIQSFENNVLIWIYNPEKANDPIIALNSAKNIKILGNNKYSFEDQSNNIYEVEAVLPNICKIGNNQKQNSQKVIYGCSDYEEETCLTDANKVGPCTATYIQPIRFPQKYQVGGFGCTKPVEIDLPSKASSYFKECKQQ